MQKLMLFICLFIIKNVSAQWAGAGSSSGSGDMYYNGGNVGIGTNNPTNTLTIKKNNAGQLGATILLDNNGPAVGDATAIQFTSGGISNMRAQIKSTVENSPNHGTLEFWTGLASFGGLSEKMRITGIGNIGIGTTSPGAKLNVYSLDSSAPVKAVFGGSVNPSVLYPGYNSQTNSAIEISSTSGVSNGGPWLILSNNAAPNAASFNAGVVSFTLPATTAAEKRAAVIVSETSANSTSAISANLRFYTNNAGSLAERLRIDPNGNVGVGTIDPGGYKLAVNGNIRAKEIKVETGWADFVFERGYKLPDLKDTEQFIKENGHLPEIPSAKEVAENGLNLGEMDSKLLQKIEELTLHLINQDKQLKIQNDRINFLEGKKRLHR